MTKLRIYFVAFFLLLAIPLGLLLRRTYSSLEQESFFFYRRAAESVLLNVGEALLGNLQTEESRPYTQYRYVHVADHPVPEQAGLNLSPLAAFPVQSEIPGILGYFQFDPDGSFHTPLLPDAEQHPGLMVPRRPERETLQARLASLLANDRPGFPLETDAAADEALEASQSPQQQAGEFRQELESNVDAKLEQKYLDSQSDEYSSAVSAPQQRYSRKVQKASPSQARIFDSEFDNELSKAGEKQKNRLEKTVAEPVEVKETARGRVAAGDQPAGAAPEAFPGVLDIEAEVDPFQTRVVDDQWVVFSRRVWWQDRRYLQGFVADLAALLREHLEPSLQSSVLPENASFLLFHEDELLSSQGLPSGPEEKPVLLYSAELPHPFNRFNVALAVASLPRGPGHTLAQLLGVYLTVLLVGGLYVIYRLAATQLDLSQKKADFVSAVSHELKTPLSTIRMYGEVLVEGWVEDDEKRQSYYHYIHDESERLSRLIQNVLQLAELERNEWQVQLAAEDPVRLVEEIVQGLEARLTRAGFQAVTKVQGDPARIRVDRDAMTQILINLIDNSIKFSKGAQRKEIQVTISQLGEECFIRVRDFGPGIPRPQLKKIFQKFYRIDSEMTRTTRGTGIGLALVKMLADAMRASVDVVNRDPGVEFSLRFRVLG